MNYSLLANSSLFSGLSATEIATVLESTTHHVHNYEKGEIIFRLMEPASRIGVILEGRVEAQKSFPNGSQVNVFVRGPGEMIGPAAVFAGNRNYPCDIVSLEPVTVMMFHRDDLLRLMQSDVRILENFTTVIASSTHMLQLRLELLSYSGIAQKVAFWLLMQMRRSGNRSVPIPESISKWAMLMNVSRPSLHRELRRMKEEGIISYEPPTITINNADALQSILSM